MKKRIRIRFRKGVDTIRIPFLFPLTLGGSDVFTLNPRKEIAKLRKEYIIPKRATVDFVFQYGETSFPTGEGELIITKYYKQ